MGRFISADTIIPDATVPQSYNRYSYIYNQPLNLTDPTGHCPCLVDGGPGFADGSFTPTGDNVPQVLTDSELGAIGNVASLVPILDTGDDFLTATTGCGYTCQAGDEGPGGGFWRTVAVVGLIAPISSSMIRHGVDEVAGLLGKFGDDVARLADDIPSVIYREGGTNPANLTPRAIDEGHLSFRDSLSNPYPLADGQRPVLRSGQPYFGVDTSKLPTGTVIPDNIPPGHVSVLNVSPATIKDAVIIKGYFPE